MSSPLRLTRGLEDLAAEHGLQVASVPGLVTLFFRSRTRWSTSTTRSRPTATPTRGFCRGMLERGIYLPPSRFEAWFVSLAHDEKRDRPRPSRPLPTR